jgi:hypothetical protein
MFLKDETVNTQPGEAPLVVVDRSEMLAIIADAMDEKMVPLTDAFRERLGREPIKPIRQVLGPNQEVTRTGSQRFRVREIGPMVVSGIINQTTPRGLRDMILASFASILRGVASVQTNGDWQAIAWEGRQGYKLRRVKVTSHAAQDWSPLQEDSSRYGGGRPNPQKTKPQWSKDPSITIYVVFVDMSNGDEQDPWYLRTGKNDGSMQAWTQQGILPPVLQEERKNALDILSRWLRKADLQEEAPPANILTESRLDGAARLLLAGASLELVAEAIGVTPDALKEALVQHGHFTTDNFPSFVANPGGLAGDPVPPVEPEEIVEMREGPAPTRPKARK